MLRFERTTDLRRVHALVTDPRVYRSAQPYHPKREEWQPPKDAFYLAAVDETGWLGIYIFEPHREQWEVHIAMAPQAWGRGAQISHECVKWLRENTACEKLVAHIPVANRLAVRVALAAGMSGVTCSATHSSFEMNL